MLMVPVMIVVVAAVVSSELHMANRLWCEREGWKARKSGIQLPICRSQYCGTATKIRIDDRPCRLLSLVVFYPSMQSSSMVGLRIYYSYFSTGNVRIDSEHANIDTILINIEV